MNASKQAKVFHSLIIHHKTLAAVRFISEREKGRVYIPYDVNEKSGYHVIDVLRGKYPGQRAVVLEDITMYYGRDDLLDITVGPKTVYKVDGKLYGSVGAGVMDSIAMRLILLSYRAQWETVSGHHGIDDVAGERAPPLGGI